MKKIWIGCLAFLAMCMLTIGAACEKNEGVNTESTSSESMSSGGGDSSASDSSAEEGSGEEETRYTVTFKADGVTVGKRTYSEEDRDITPPQVPEKTGYTGEWESYVLTTGDEIVNAIYTPIVYTVTFKADEITVGTQTYTVENRDITPPQVPDLRHKRVMRRSGKVTT